MILDDKGEPLVNDILHAPNPAGPAGVVPLPPQLQLAIPRYSKNVEASKDFIRWLMEREQLSKYLRRSQAYHAAALKVYLQGLDVGHVPGAASPSGITLLQGRHLG